MKAKKPECDRYHMDYGELNVLNAAVAFYRSVNRHVRSFGLNPRNPGDMKRYWRIEWAGRAPVTAEKRLYEMTVLYLQKQEREKKKP